MKKLFPLIIFCATLILISCKKDKKETTESGPSSDLKKAAVKTYAKIVYASYSDALEGAQNLEDKIEYFLQDPTDNNRFEACKQAWLDARIPYNQTESYRFYNGPIDDANGPEGQINAWPLDESYIDYVNGNASAGIINNTSVSITAAGLAALNGVGGEANVSTGYHAIEFLLWGQDLIEVGNDPGQRPNTDYVTPGGTASNQVYRGQYLQACATLLISDLQTLVDEWAPNNASNYRARFESADPDASLTKILQGLGFFSKGEMAGERMTVAYETKDREDEHSCFSDNTTNDIRYWIRGIKNVYTGTYTKTDGTVISGTSISEVISAKNGELAVSLNDNITASLEKCNDIPAPFDQQILPGSPGRAKIKKAIDSLKAQADKIAQAASELGLGNITVE